MLLVQAYIFAGAIRQRPAAIRRLPGWRRPVNVHFFHLLELPMQAELSVHEPLPSDA